MGAAEAREGGTKDEGWAGSWQARVMGKKPADFPAGDF